ncbi:hypothetical protein [Larkinella rosea]|uniref:Uncharacterized protein n=1 Tax=Larkinella rosea TaxID=2025312 RepID=A0A3P1BN75_9BACT|nr:hypothetical protein [Larkinella rosea]RRB02522.1 hypothetical protein EHT25_18885 [Larkinella rosea]
MKRKIIYCLIFLTGSVYQAHSQTIPKNSFRIGVGTAWPQVGEGTGMKGGIVLSNEYLRELKKRLFLGASLHYLTRYSGFKNQINYSGSDDQVPNFLKNKRVNHESVVAGYIN